MRGTRLTIPDLLGIAVWVIAEEIHRAKDEIMATLDQAKTDADALVTLVQTLIDAFNAAKNGTLTDAQQATVDAIDADIQAVSSAVTDAETPPAS